MPAEAAKGKAGPPKKRQTATSGGSSLTPESFERELKELAKQAQDETWGKWLAEQALVYGRSALLLTLIAVFSHASQLALSPVYGSIPSAVWHRRLVVAACFVGWSSNLWLRRLLPVKPIQLLPLIAMYIPVAQYFLGKISGLLTAQWGPLVTEMLTLFPLISISVSCVADYVNDADLSALPSFIADAAPGMGSFGFYQLMRKLSGDLIQRNVGKMFVWTRLGLETLLVVPYALLAPSTLLLYGIPAALHTAVLNNHVELPMALQSVNQTLNTDGWAILDRKESLTGYISVVESLKDGFRVMRCDHSLLGGEWVRFKGGRVAEPVYGVFAMLEAVRLVDVPEPVPDDQAQALVVGLGIGTTPAALVAHGIKTTVVEIDPVVHEFAEAYFQLPSNHTAVIDDAVAYVANQAQQGRQRFDYIVHDVFTGGAEPISLFTLEFLENLSALLNPNGVIAINYAGDFMLPPPRMIEQTIRHVFPSCRIFREHARNNEAVKREGRDFTNMVFFCTKKASGKLTFRPATAADMLGSRSRDAFLVPRHEVTDCMFVAARPDLGVLRKNDTAKLEKWQTQSALGHWEVMRTVLPKIVWENW